MHYGARSEGAYTATCSVASVVSFCVESAIRISIISPCSSVACTVPPAMRIATDRPLQRTRNDMLRHRGGSLGSIPSVSPPRSRPAYNRLPKRAQPGDPDAAGAVRVEVEIGRCSLTQIAQRNLRLAQTRRD